MKSLITILSCLLIVYVDAQVCTSNLGSPAVNVTFGQGNIILDIGPELPAGVTNLTYRRDRCPGGNGIYSIVTFTTGCFGLWGNLNSDHTGNPNGYFMLIDASDQPSDFYVQTVDGLCSGTTYEFAAWALNMYNNRNGVNPNITFTVEEPGGAVLASYTTGDILPTYPGTNVYTWKQYGMFFVTPPGINSVVLRMRNNATGGNGNDLALDDITFRPAGPNIKLSVAGGTDTSVELCSGSTNAIEISSKVDECYISTAYQWQQSTDGITWTDMPGQTGPIYTRPPSSVGKFYYRLAAYQAGNTSTYCRIYSDPYTVTVNPPASSSVSIAGPTGPLCTGTPATFTATPVNGGTAPSYQWKLNGTDVGTNSATYTSSTLSDNDVVMCVLTSNAGCPVSVNSNEIVVDVIPPVTPGLSIAANGNDICLGTAVTFTATPSNGGGTPGFQWKVNGADAGASTATFTSNTLANSDIVTCILTSNATCATSSTVVSNEIAMVVNGLAAPSVTVAADTNDVCPGTLVTFTATPVNGGPTPAYQWKINGVNTGTNTATFTSSTLANGDIITNVLTSNSGCVTSPTANSNSVTAVIKASSAPSVSITTPATTLCAGSAATFTATASNAGTTPGYQWKLNGTDVGTNTTTYTNSGLADNDVVTCVVTNPSGCAAPATSNSITIKITAPATPAVSIAASGNDVCANTPITFTATAVNGGGQPAYQWKINGSDAGAGSATFTSSTLANEDVVTCTLTSNLGCTTTPTAISNEIVMVINSLTAPSVAIVADKNEICPGATITFSATPVNGGMSPAFQWKINGTNTGGNSPIFTGSTFSDGDVVTCVLTSNSACVTSPTATSNDIAVVIAAPIAPGITIATDASSICAGQAPTFTATVSNAGTAPTYQWTLNGVDAGTNSATYTNGALSDNDVVGCILTTSSGCYPPVASNNITITVASLLSPAVTITASENEVCAGTEIIFTATPVNGGTQPTYQWKLNGSDVGTGTPVFSSSSIANGDVVTCTLTSSLNCVSGPTATSNSIEMSITSLAEPSVTIAADNATICQGSPVTFTATPVNGGTMPIYQWKINGINTGTDAPTFTSSTLSGNDIVTCVLTSNSTCTTSPTANSNSVAINVTTPVTPEVTITATSTNICEGSTVTFTATATNSGTTASYEWRVNGNAAGSNGASFTSATLADGDLVSCRITTSNGCLTTPNAISNNIAITVNKLPTPLLTIDGPRNICQGTPATFTASTLEAVEAPVYQWKVNATDAGTTGATFTSSTLGDGDIVSFVLVGSQGCTIPVPSDSITMEVYPLPTITMEAGKTIDKGSSVQLAPAITGDIISYTWLPAVSLNNNRIASPVASPQTATVYNLRVNTKDNCEATASIAVKVLVTIKIPNAFSPNGDGINDVWNITGLADYSGSSVDIFTRYGQPVFHSNGYNAPWDGTNKGKPLPIGEYYYIINLGNGDKQMTGGVMLVR